VIKKSSIFSGATDTKMYFFINCHYGQQRLIFENKKTFSPDVSPSDPDAGPSRLLSSSVRSGGGGRGGRRLVTAAVEEGHASARRRGGRPQSCALVCCCVNKKENEFS
jgi:hypothetical protein